MDIRDIRTGYRMPAENYSDQPYVVKAQDGAWVMVVTTGQGFEGEWGQHVISSRSLDQGKTWETPVDVERANAPESSYAVAYVTPYGRIYCFYNYNKDNVREIPASLPGGIFRRVDSLGHFGFKYSDDNGKSWSEEYYEIPIRLMKIDREDNPTGGKIPFFWNVGKPLVTGEGVCVPLYKIGHVGEGAWRNTEGVLNLCRNLDTEKDPRKLTWETLPEGDEGIHADRARFGFVSEEHSFVRLSDGSIFTVFRTVAGRPFYAISRDEGHHFTEPRPLCYRSGRPVFHGRAANFLWKCENGKYLYWHNNVRSYSWEGRNPVFLSGGVEVPGEGGLTLEFSEPEVILYHPDPCIRISYPDLVEEDGAYYITETEKQVARVHPLNASLLEELWQDAARATAKPKGELLGDRVPTLPPFWRATHTFDAHGEQADLSFAFAMNYTLGPKETVLSFMEDGIGCELCSNGKNLTLRMSDGLHSFYLDSPPITPGQHRIALLVDGGCHVVRFVIDGATPLPEEGKRYTFGIFDLFMAEILQGQSLYRAESVEDLRFYQENLSAAYAAMVARGLGFQ